MRPGLSTAITQQRNRLSTTPFNPSQTLNSVLIYWNKAGNCYTDNPPTVVATAGQAVATSKAQYGTSINAVQATALLRPTFRADGLEFGALGTQFQSFTEQVLGAFTVYIGMTADAGSTNCPALGNSTGGAAMVGINSGVVNVFDDGFNGLAGNTASGRTLIRFNVDSGGNGSLISTGQSENTGGGFGAFTLNAIMQALLGNNDSTANRVDFIWLIARSIALGNAEDLVNRGWITSNLNYSL